VERFEAVDEVYPLYSAPAVCASVVAQRPDTRLSGEPLGSILPEDAKIESVAAIGSRTLAVWGTSRFTPDSLVVNTLVMQMLDDTAMLGAQKRIVSDSARPSEFVQVVPLADRFLVVWNDKRNGDTATWMRLVDIDGDPLGEERPLGNARISGFGVAAIRTGDRYLLFWNNITGSATRIHTAILDSTGNLLAIDTSTRFEGKLGGAPDIYDYRGRLILDRGALRPLVVDSSGGITEAISSIVRDTLRPWYLDRDGSVITAGNDSVRFYRSVFDEVPYRAVVSPSIYNKLAPFVPVRDSLGRLRLVWFESETITRDQFVRFALLINVFSVNLTGIDTYTRPVMNASYPLIWLLHHHGEDSYSVSGVRISLSREPGGIYRVTASCLIYVEGDENPRPTTVRFTIGDYGVIQSDQVRQHFPRLRWTQPQLDRILDFDSSVVTVHSLGKRKRLASATAIEPTVLAQIKPVLSLQNDSLIATWSSFASGPSYTTVRWDPLDRTSVAILATIDSMYLAPPSTPDASYYSTQLLLQSESRSYLSVISRWQDSLYSWHTAHLLFAWGSGGWGTVNRIEQTDTVPRVMTAHPYQYDPNTGQRLGVVGTLGSNTNIIRATVSAYNQNWEEVWRLDSAISLVYETSNYFVPIADSEFLHFTNSHAGHRKGRELLGQFDVLPIAGERFFKRLLGPYFLQVSRDLADSLGDIQLYSLDGTRIAQHRMKGIRVDDIAVVQNRSDSSIAIVSATSQGVSVTLLDSRLDVRAVNKQLSATRDSTARPTAVIRNDTLIAVWEDYRNGSSDVYGTFIPLTSLTAVPSLEAASGETVAISEVLPNPASDYARIRFTRPPGRRGTIELIDNSGTVRWRSICEEGMQSIDIDCSSLPEGLYMVVIRVGSELGSGRLVVVR
jgi:hypothetical protein